jgi:hypothetical protein
LRNRFNTMVFNVPFISSDEYITQRYIRIRCIANEYLRILCIGD